MNKDTLESQQAETGEKTKTNSLEAAPLTADPKAVLGADVIFLPDQTGTDNTAS